MNRFEQIQIRRREIHRAAADASWSRLRAMLDSLGVRYELFGSFAHGTFLEHSDIDLMVMGELDATTRSQVRRAVSAQQAEMGVNYDLYFERDFSPEECAVLLGH